MRTPGKSFFWMLLRSEPLPLTRRTRISRPAVVALGALDRGVAAAPDDQRGLGADQARGVDEEVEIGEALRGRVVPA